MSEYIPVPVEAAKHIAKLYQKSIVVIMCYDPVHGLTHTTTYGVSAFDKENAATAGDICAKALGSDLSKRQTFEDFRDDYDPALFKESMDILGVINRRQGTTPVQLQQIERLLKLFGKGVHRA